MGLKTASFHVRADTGQSARWKQAAEAEGYASVGAWAAAALDAYLEHRAQAGKPLPLAWRRRRFRVRLLDGSEPDLPGWVAEPFGYFRGDAAGPGYNGCHIYSLVYLPDARLLATFRYARHCRSLASELARLWVRWGREEPAEDAAPIFDRYRLEPL